MTVHFLEGFDIVQRNFDWAYGVDDLSNYLVPWAQYSYISGAVAGRALWDQTGSRYTMHWGGGTHYAKLPRGGPVHVYFAIRYEGSGASSGIWNPLFFFSYGGGNLEPEKNFGIQISNSGFWRLARGGLTAGAHGEDTTFQVLSSSFDASLKMTEDMVVGKGWAYVHLAFDPASDQLTLWVNGDLIYQVQTNANVDANFNWTFTFNRTGGPYTVIDHLVIADAALPSTGTHAIAVTAMQATPPGKTGNGQYFTGALVMDDQVIKASKQFPNDWEGASSVLDPGFLGHSNPANEVMWVWGRDPRDNSAWTPAKLAEVQAWGLCNRADAFSEGNSSRYNRITNCFLTYVETDTKGWAPLVRVQEPGAAIFLEDIWEKTNPDMAFSAHLNELPRVNTYADDKWIMTNKTGCLLFNNGKRPFDWTGITFAQEYREDFYDFVLVDGAGNNFQSWFISGYSILGDSNKDFQSNYVTVNYEYPSGSAGAYLQPVWEYSIDPETGRWGTKQQVYKDDQGYKHGSRKLKARGHGKALQFKVSSVDQKDFVINGWGVFVLANQLP